MPRPTAGDLANPRVKLLPLTCPALAGIFFTTSTTWEALDIYSAPGNFPTQEWNQSPLHCRRILYQMSYQGSLRYTYKYRYVSSSCISIYLSICPSVSPMIVILCIFRGFCISFHALLPFPHLLYRSLCLNPVFLHSPMCKSTLLLTIFYVFI